MLCLVMEFPVAEGLVTFTQENPGSTIELMGEATPDGAGRTSALMLVRGAPWQAIDKFVADLAAARGPVTTLRRVPLESLWFGRVSFDMSAMRSPGALALHGLIPMLGPPWVHIEHGVVHLRARLKDPAHAEDVLFQAQEGLSGAGLEVQAVVQEVAPKDHSVWESLVQRSLGIAP